MLLSHSPGLISCSSVVGHDLAHLVSLIAEHLTGCLIVAKNTCTNIPNIHQPPWNEYQNLSLNATGDVTSNATGNSNNTIPPSELQLSPSPLSLSQGMDANSVDTS